MVVASIKIFLKAPDPDQRLPTFRPEGQSVEIALQSLESGANTGLA